MSKIIIIYATTDGYTKKICSRLLGIIETNTHDVTLVAIEDVKEQDLRVFDKIVIGASIRYGKHRPEVYQFISQNIQILDSKPNAFFTVNVVARKPDKNLPENNPYLIKFLSQISWKPKQLGVFAGKINYQQYKFIDRFMIKLIMRMTKGPTAPDTNVEFTNWQKVEEFGQLISEM